MKRKKKRRNKISLMETGEKLKPILQMMNGINCYRCGKMTQDITFLKLKMMNNSMTHILNGQEIKFANMSE